MIDVYPLIHNKVVFKTASVILITMQELSSNQSNVEDHQLLERARQNDMQAIGIIHDIFYPKVWNYVCYRISDTQICEDITAEVFLRFITHLQKDNKGIDHLSGWLMGTAHHIVMDHYREIYRKPTSDLESHIDLRTVESTQEEVEQLIKMEDLQAILCELTNEQQFVINLRFSQGYSLEETAREMKKSTGSIKLLQHRAMQTIRKHFNKRGWE